MKGLQIVHKNNGNQDWILSAERADFTGDGNNAHLTKLKLKTEQKGMMILAEKGLYNIKDRSLTVDGTVIAKNGDVSITADNVEMDSRGGKLSAQGRVTVEGSKFNLRGTGMTFDDAEQKMRILNDVQATFYR